MADITLNRDTSTAIEVVEDPRMHRSAANAKDINDFVIYADAGFQDYQKRLGYSPVVPIKYISPKEFVENPNSNADVILFKLLSRRRMNTSNRDDRRPFTPQLREEIQSNENPDEIIRISGYKRENLVEFQVWSKHTRNANDLARRLEAFMQAYLFYFMDMGFNRVIFEERGEDETHTIGASEFYVRPIRYQVLTELLYQEVSNKLKQVILNYDTGIQIQTEVLDENIGYKRYSILHDSE